MTPTLSYSKSGSHFEEQKWNRNFLKNIYDIVSGISEIYLSSGSIYNPFKEYNLIDIKDKKFELVREPPGTASKVFKDDFQKSGLLGKLFLIAIKISYFITLGILPLIAAIFALINRIIHKPHFLPKVSDEKVREIYYALHAIEDLKLKKLENADVDKMRKILGTSTFSKKIKNLTLDSVNLTDEKNWKDVPGIPKDYLLRQICLMFPKLEEVQIYEESKPEDYSYNVQDINPDLKITNVYYNS